MKYKTKNLEEFKKVAEEFLSKLKNIDKKEATIVLLIGNLGAGKTTFVQNFAKILNIKNKINSPTFVLMKRYPIGKTYGVNYASNTPLVFKNLYHMDAYRLEGSKNLKKELENIKFNDILKNKENLIFIEWGEIIEKYIPKEVIRIKISHLENGGRSVEML